MTLKINHAFSLCLIILISGLSQIAMAQSSFWEPVGDLDGKIITKLSFTQSGAIFAGSDSGIFRSSDLGESWVKLKNGIPEEQIYDLKVNSRDEIFAATRSGLYFFDDEGSSWENRTGGLNLRWVRSIAVPSTDSLFICAVDSTFGYPGSIYFSSDNGLSWIQINNGLLFQSVFDKDFIYHCSS
jgi:ligand-binding sensor domain-containing protein